MVNKFNSSSLLQYQHNDYVIHDKKRLHDGFFKVDQYLLSHKTFNGEQSDIMTREIFERGNAVVVIPYDPVNDVLVLNEQFRPGALTSDTTPWLLEFVAGMFAEHESPIEVAIREAKEEANLTLDVSTMFEVMQYFSSPGGTSEKIHLYIAKVNSEGVGGVYGLAQEHEDIMVHTVTRSQAMELLHQGKISNAATIIGLQWLALNFEQLQRQWSAHDK